MKTSSILLLLLVFLSGNALALKKVYCPASLHCEYGYCTLPKYEYYPAFYISSITIDKKIPSVDIKFAEAWGNAGEIYCVYVHNGKAVGQAKTYPSGFTIREEGAWQILNEGRTYECDTTNSLQCPVYVQ